MAVFPLIEYHRDGQSVTMKLPDSVDLWAFLEWMDINFCGLTAEKLASMRAADAVEAKRVAKGKRK